MLELLCVHLAFYIFFNIPKMEPLIFIVTYLNHLKLNLSLVLWLKSLFLFLLCILYNQNECYSGEKG